jgi:hypothetical protein
VRFRASKESQAYESQPFGPAVPISKMQHAHLSLVRTIELTVLGSQIELGIVPVIPVSIMFRASRYSSTPISLGTVPPRFLQFENSRNFKSTRLPNSDGKLPVNAFDDTNRSTNWVHLPISEGTEPVRLSEAASNRSAQPARTS